MAKSLAMCFLLLAVLTSEVKGRNLGEIPVQKNYYSPDSHDQTSTPSSIKKPDCVITPTPAAPSHGGTSPPSHGGTSTPPSTDPTIGTSPPSHSGSGSGTGTPSAPSHSGSGGHYGNPPTPLTPTPSAPSHGGYYGNPPTPSTPSHGGYYGNPPTPLTPSTPSHGGYYGSPPPLVPIITGPPSIPVVTPVTPAPPLVPLSPFVPTTPPTPFLPVIPPTTPTPTTPTPFDPNIGIPPFFTGTCDFWRTHPTIILGLLGYWGTMGGLFGPITTSSFGQNLSILDALSNRRTDGLGSLFREGTAALLNSMVNTKFPFTSEQVRESFVGSVHSNVAARKQANVFKKANEGRFKRN
ncbi:hypothetical protein LUZ60_008427 [Juncus effusus]|nr:hypothetical protein LUZ60_008427 [Juncus effusus]